jgi:hypothetical protein
MYRYDRISLPLLKRMLTWECTYTCGLDAQAAASVLPLTPPDYLTPLKISTQGIPRTRQHALGGGCGPLYYRSTVEEGAAAPSRRLLVRAWDAR